MRIINNTLKSLVYVFGLMIIYYFYGFYRNEYAGYKQLLFNFDTLFELLFASFFCYYIIKKKYKKPSDFFIFFYSVIIFIPYIILHGIWGRYGFQAFHDFIILFTPILVISCLGNIKYTLPRINLYSRKTSLFFLIVIAIITSFYLLKFTPSSASFSLQDAYTRRLESRSLYGRGTILSYLSAMTMNGIMPFFVYYFVYSKRTRMLIIPLSLFIIFFYVYGVKAPLLYMTTSGLLALYARKYKLNKYKNNIFNLLLLILCISLLEILIFNYSYIEDYLIRRVFYVGSYLVGAYFELADTPDFSWAMGVQDIKSASIYVGQKFLGVPGLNANTNTFLYFLIQYGVFGYIAIILFIGVVFSCLNQLSKKNHFYLYLSFIYSLLLLEQSATTAMVSSGVGLLLIIFYFSDTDRKYELDSGPKSAS